MIPRALYMRRIHPFIGSRIADMKADRNVNDEACCLSII